LSGIGQYIRSRRNALDITQEDLATRLAERGHKFAKSTIGWWETDRSIPPIHESKFMAALAASLEVSLSALIEGLGIYDDKIEANDLSPSEAELIAAYRSGDVEKVMRITLGKNST
jgi:transcriptional regulator with XRE-family HTH domain